MHKSNVVMQWRKSSRGYYITGSKCKECSHLFFPVRSRCLSCGSVELEDYRFKGTGKVYSFSTIHYPPADFEKQVPYTVAIIRLDEGPKMAGQLVECEEPKTGMKVESCVRKIYEDGSGGIIHYGIKFRPSE